MIARTDSDATDRVIAGRIRLHTPRLLFARAEATTAELIISGLRWSGRYRRSYDLADLERVDWWAGTESGPNLAVHFHDGTVVAFWVRRAGIWRFKLEEFATLKPVKRPAGIEKLLRVA